VYQSVDNTLAISGMQPGWQKGTNAQKIIQVVYPRQSSRPVKKEKCCAGPFNF